MFFLVETMQTRTLLLFLLPSFYCGAQTPETNGITVHAAQGMEIRNEPSVPVSNPETPIEEWPAERCSEALRDIEIKLAVINDPSDERYQRLSKTKELILNRQSVLSGPPK